MSLLKLATDKDAAEKLKIGLDILNSDKAKLLLNQLTNLLKPEDKEIKQTADKQYHY